MKVEVVAGGPAPTAMVEAIRLVLARLEEPDGDAWRRAAIIEGTTSTSIRSRDELDAAIGRSGGLV